MNLKQFDIVLARLWPTVGSEQSGLRPCLILETNAFEGRGSITVVTPLTSNIKKVYALQEVIEPSKENGLKERSKLLVRQIKAIDKKRIIKYLGHLEKEYHGNILNSLAILFDFRGDFSR